MYGRHVNNTDHKSGRRMNKNKDRRAFSRTADQTQSANTLQGRPMRGGIRL